MSPLDILQLVGYSIAALLPLWMAVQLVSHRARLTSLERMLFALALTMGGWHTSNLVITLHRLFRLGLDNWTTVLRIADTVAVISITFAYSFLLHVHLDGQKVVIDENVLDEVGEQGGQRDTEHHGHPEHGTEIAVGPRHQHDCRACGERRDDHDQLDTGRRGRGASLVRQG